MNCIWFLGDRKCMRFDSILLCICIWRARETKKVGNESDDQMLANGSTDDKMRRKFPEPPLRYRMRYFMLCCIYRLHFQFTIDYDERTHHTCLWLIFFGKSSFLSWAAGYWIFLFLSVVRSFFILIGFLGFILRLLWNRAAAAAGAAASMRVHEVNKAKYKHKHVYISVKEM